MPVVVAATAQAMVPMTASPTRAADLLAGVDQAGDEADVLAVDAGDGEEGQRREQQAHSGRDCDHRAEQAAGVVAVLLSRDSHSSRRR